MKKTLAALSFAALVLVGCQNSGQQTTTTTTNTATGASTPVAMTTVAPGHDEHAGHASPTDGQTAGHDDMKMGTSGMDALRNLKGKDFDIAFMSQMIVHHQGAVEMAKQALSVAKDDETKRHAQTIIDAQNKEIEQMRGWLKEWYQTEPLKEQEDLMHKDMAHMMSMPVKNDHDFYDMMIPHHEGAVEMSQLAQDRADKPQLKELAAKMVKDQQAEIEQFRKLSEAGH